jgi:hypothetical protein
MPHTPPDAPTHTDSHAGPGSALWDALSEAGPSGATISDLMTACGMGRSWVYNQLRVFSRAGRAVQTVRGHWRAVGGQSSGGDRA